MRIFIPASSLPWQGLNYSYVFETLMFCLSHTIHLYVSFVRIQLILFFIKKNLLFFIALFTLFLLHLFSILQVMTFRRDLHDVHQGEIESIYRVFKVSALVYIFSSRLYYLLIQHFSPGHYPNYRLSQEGFYNLAFTSRHLFLTYLDPLHIELANVFELLNEELSRPQVAAMIVRIILVI